MHSNRALRSNTPVSSSDARPAPRGAGTNRLRIIAGAWRGRRIHFDDLPGLRPTPDRVRETLFNWLGQDLTTKRCLDLFAGSGALGFEALSRNALSVCFVEYSRHVAETIRRNARTLAADRWTLRCCDALEFLESAQAVHSDDHFDVVFLDPPFGANSLERVLPLLAERVAPGGVVYVESEAAFDFDARSEFQGWQVIKRARAGAVHYGLIESRQRTGEVS